MERKSHCLTVEGAWTVLKVVIDSLTNYACLCNVYIYQLFPGHVIAIFLLVCVCVRVCARACVCVCVCIYIYIKIVLVMFKCVALMEFNLHFKLEMYFYFIVFCVIKLK